MNWNANVSSRLEVGTPADLCSVDLVSGIPLVQESCRAPKRLRVNPENIFASNEISLPLEETKDIALVGAQLRAGSDLRGLSGRVCFHPEHHATSCHLGWNHGMTLLCSHNRAVLDIGGLKP